MTEATFTRRTQQRLVDCDSDGQIVLENPAHGLLFRLRTGAVRVVFESEYDSHVIYIPYGKWFMLNSIKYYEKLVPGIKRIKVQGMSSKTSFFYRDADSVLKETMEKGGHTKVIELIQATSLEAYLLKKQLPEKSTSTPRIHYVRSILEKLIVDAGGIVPDEDMKVRVYVGSESEHADEMMLSRSTVKRLSSELRKCGMLLESRKLKYLTVNMKLAREMYPAIISELSEAHQSADGSMMF